MISRIFSNFKSVLKHGREIRQKSSLFLKSKSGKSICGALILTGFYGHLINSDEDYLVDEFPRSLPVTLYRVLPLCQLSRMFGNLANTEIPESLRGILLGFFVWQTGADLSDYKITDVKEYKSFSELFRRQLKWDSRVIDRDCDMVSPCDGKVLYCGRADNDTIDQVKGVNFTIGGFLGKDYLFWKNKYSMIEEESSKTETSLAKKTALKRRQLFYITLYLAPGDYHRFHAPTELDIGFRRYFSGKLLSVNPILAKLIPGLFSVNERVVYFGQWKYGLFSFTAVGATNVGNIRVFSDLELPTNQNHQFISGELDCRLEAPASLERHIVPSMRVSRGQLFGEFNLGSTIVLLFEAPSDFEFAVAPGEKVRMGVSLGGVGGAKKESQCRQM